MYPTYKFLVIIAFLFFLPFSVVSQIAVSSTGGLPTNAYSTLKGAFDAINLGVHQGQITILVTGSTTETATAQLNASGGTSSYSSVTITPANTCTISGSIAGPLINLNGADTVSIDGRIGGIGNTRSLTIQNVYNGTAAPAYALQLINGANQNSFKYVCFEGLGQSQNNNSTIRAFGFQKRNVFSYNEIRPVANGFQNAAIFANGDSCTIEGNIIHDFISFGSSFSSAGIDIQSGTNFIITGNSIYQTVPINQSTNFGQAFIRTFGGSNYRILSNYIGGSQPGALGNPTVYSGNYFVTGISCYQNVGGEIDSNIITNIVLNSATTSQGFSGISVASSSYKVGLNSGNTIGSVTDTNAITISLGSIIGIGATGSVSFSTTDIQNNKIGGLRANGGGTNTRVYGIDLYDMDTATIKNNVIGGNISGSIKFVSPSGELRGISITRGKAKSRINCSQNTIQNLSAEFSGTGNFFLSGIFSGSQGDTSKRWIMSNDISKLTAVNYGGDVTLNGIYSGPSIVGVTPVLNSIIRENSIHDLNILGGGASSAISGIRNEIQSSSYVIIDSNIISSIASAAPNISGVTIVAVQGIGLFYSSYGSSIASNIIDSLSSTSTLGTNIAAINALHNNDLSPLTIAGNQINNLYNDSSVAASVSGILLGGSGVGSFIVKNNMLSLSPDYNSVYGIFNNLGVTQVKCYSNSVFIAGSSSGNNTSSAFNRIFYANTAVDLRNNLFVNVRSGGIGGHYSLMNGNASPSIGWASSNYNNLFSASMNSTALWGSTALSFPSYQTASLKDSCSVSQLVDFINPVTADLHLQNTPNNQWLTGKAIAGVTDDFDGDPRNPYPTMGADELNLAFQGVTIAASGPTSFCPGGSVTLTSSFVHGNQWLKNGQPLAGDTLSILVVNQTGSYSVYYANGCLSDTSNVISVMVKPAYNDTIPVLRCHGESYSFGTQQLTVSGFYTDSLSTIFGCDSVVTIDLTVYKINDTIYQSGDTLSSLAQGTYKWVTCDNNYSPIFGATGPTYIATVSTNYAVIIKSGNCIDTSDCVFVTLTDVNKIINDRPQASIYPNPGNSSFTVSFNQPVQSSSIEIVNALGQLVRQATVLDKKFTSIDMSSYRDGVYFIQIKTYHGRQQLVWVKSASAD